VFKKREVTDELINNIVTSYKQGNTISFIAKLFHIRFITVRKILNEYGIVFRRAPGRKLNINEDCAISLYKKYDNITKVARKLDVSPDVIRRILERNNIRLLNNLGGAKKFDKYYFDVVNTEVKAYFLGLLFADGSIRKIKGEDSFKISLGLTETDSYLVEKFKEVLKSEHKIQTYKCSSGTTQYRLAIHNKYFGESLVRAGLLPDKVKYSRLPQLSEELTFHFLRGLLDGDGSIVIVKNKRLLVVIYGNYAVLNDVKLFLDNKNIKACVYKHKNFFSLHICRQVCVLKFLEMLYKDATIKMERKYKKYVGDNK